MLKRRATNRIAVRRRALGSHWLLSSVLAGALPACAAQSLEPSAAETDDEAQALIAAPATLATATLASSAVVLKAGSLAQKLVCSAPADGTRPDPTLVNTDSFVLSRFGLQKVYNQLITTSGVAAPTAVQLYQQMWDSMDTAANAKFNAPHCDDNGSTLNGFPIDCPRPETQLKDTLPSKFTPVALFNRFDLAPSDGSNCGEYRIVYAMNGSGGGGYPGGGFNPDLPIEFQPPGPIPGPDPIGPVLSTRAAAISGADVINPAKISAAAVSASVINTSVVDLTRPIIIQPQPQVKGRGFIIFEGILPNPKPGCGLEACRPVVKFWENMSSLDPTTAAGQTALADGLEQFYFKGLSGGFEPVIHANHYGVTGGGGYGERSGGQIRTNMFVDFVNWQLREFHLVTDCSTGSCKQLLQPVTVKTNPFHEMFDPSNPAPDPRAAGFRSVFPAETPTLSNDVITQISMRVSDKHNAGQSTSQDFGEDYEFQFNLGSPPNGFSSAIDSQLVSIARTDLTAGDITRRATTQSCAGCHQLSNDVKLGGKKNPTWPRSRGFVHVDESGFLSFALWCSFLPARKATLDTFAASPTQLCPPIAIRQPIRQVLILDPEVKITDVPNVSPSALTVSGKIAGPN